MIGQLRPTPLALPYRTAGIAPPEIRRQIQASTQKHKQENDHRQPLFDHNYPASRLKSRKSFRTVESIHPDHSTSHRLEIWNNWYLTPSESVQRPREQLPTGTNLPRKHWVSPNRARAKVGKTASNLYKWKLRPSSECPCGNPKQTVDHILTECPEGPHCTDEDLRDCTENARTWITHWRDKI